jgi:plasmid maintenance system antidote protein VapI
MGVKSRLSKEDVLQITSMAFDDNIPYSDIANQYNITISYVSNILRGRVFFYIPRRTVKYRWKRKITVERAQEILNLYRDHNVKRKHLAERFEVSVATIHTVIQGRVFPELDRTGIKQGHRRTTRIPYEVAKEVFDRVKAGERPYLVAESMDLSRSDVSRIIHGDYYADLSIGKDLRRHGTQVTDTLYVMDKKKHREAAQKGMVYNKYGMLVKLGEQND